MHGEKHVLLGTFRFEEGALQPLLSPGYMSAVM
jgi:hypothetical protein